jgi:branched-subunit amino acid transport protein
MRGQVEIWFILVGLAVVTGLTRGFFLLLGTRVELPESVQRALRYAPAGALVAIVMPEMLVIKGAASHSLSYVTLSQPHTGLYSLVHTLVISAHTPLRTELIVHSPVGSLQKVSPVHTWGLSFAHVLPSVFSAPPEPPQPIRVKVNATIRKLTSGGIIVVSPDISSALH